jgi:7-alpha-hydroxysteroid dehydrogenase
MVNGASCVELKMPVGLTVQTGAKERRCPRGFAVPNLGGLPFSDGNQIALRGIFFRDCFAFEDAAMFEPSNFRLDGAVALVTGAGAGIGRAIAETFAGAGAAVAVTDLHAETAEAVAEAIKAAGGRAIGLACNVTQESDLVSAVEGTVAEFGALTILVNNAGGGGPKPFDMPMSDMHWAFELNVFSVFRLCQLAAPHMEKAGGGAILNVTSMSAENRNKRMASYASSKAAESHLTRNIAHDLGPLNIRVNAVAPGATRTAALQKVLTPQVKEAMLKHTPLKRLGEPVDMANAALFLCSPAAAWVSGQVLTVSGGGVQELD